MENNIKSSSLSFSKGMTNNPSDLLSDDNELLECSGLIYKDSGLRPIQNPKLLCQLQGKLIFTHKAADYKNYITYDESNKKLICYINGDADNTNEFELSEVLDIASVGSTIVLTTKEGLAYILYKKGSYTYLGTNLPSPNCTFSFSPVTLTNTEKQTYAKVDAFIKFTDLYIWYLPDGSIYSCEIVVQDEKSSRVEEVVITEMAGYTKKSDGLGAIFYLQKDDSSEQIILTRSKYKGMYFEPNDSGELESKKSSFKDAIVGHVSKIINEAKKNKYFLFPFFIRYAFKLYDGSYSKISNPILCFPTVRENGIIDPVKKTNKNTEYIEWVYGKGDPVGYAYKPFKSKLLFNIASIDYENWTDIIKEFTVFVSDDVMTFKLDDDYEFHYPNTNLEKIYYDLITKEGYRAIKRGTQTILPTAVCTTCSPTKKSDKEIIEELKTKTVFYKLFSLDIGKLEHLSDQKLQASEYIENSVLENITTQEQLPKDDYYEWATSVPSNLYSYNNRLNLLNVKRYPFKGFNQFVASPNPNDSQSKRDYVFYTHIKSPNINTWVQSDSIITIPDIVQDYVFYPDPNAVEMYIHDESQHKTAHINLSQHPRLNGAYFFESLPSNDKLRPIAWEDGDIPIVADNSQYENLDSQIFTSVVNNPFVFEASGDNTIGTGEIISVVSNTQPISQGQFGQYPLFVFTTDGIYAMSVSSEGLFSSIRPYSREVCNNPSSIVQTDNTVYFCSNKGLMAIADGGVVCVSQVLNGKSVKNTFYKDATDDNFMEFIKTCFTAYDYRDSLIWFFNDDKLFAYVYSINDHTFAKKSVDAKMLSVANDYPDNLIQNQDGKVYSFLNRAIVKDDTETYDGNICTRPIKLGGSVTLKSLRKIRHLLDSTNGKLQLEIWGSNDAKHWQKLTSFRGKPWKYFTLKYNFTGLKAYDSFSGSIIDYQSRRTQR